ncbi:uncharacterized protein HD556DRAFT_1306643 [Suillus plorans]|uniref:Uncharacterized protein n=1 Tax=Suillus plorans TaxID=116603 RepID=A0A9P7IWU0_9AGAM|nr:uncharacterized protein HD556DRAFT_1306643 [Suillus plorans]KAG1796918.1 hypothetical protein HD556DRAFT_1306643 [Suillus plorans]
MMSRNRIRVIWLGFALLVHSLRLTYLLTGKPDMKALHCIVYKSSGQADLCSNQASQHDIDWIWLVSQRYVVDGNFTTQHMFVRWAWVYGERSRQTHLSLAVESKEWSSCGNYRAVNAANISRSNLQATGLIFRRVKAGIDSSLIIMMWGKVAQSKGLSVSENMHIVPAVGKFHLSAHKLACFARYSLNFIQGAGHVDGEILETLWAPFNKISSTARLISQAHRQEVLNDHMQDKLEKNSGNNLTIELPVKTLLKKYKLALKGVDDTKSPFDELTLSLDSEKILMWKINEKKAMEQRGEYLDIYQLQMNKANVMTASMDLGTATVHFDDPRFCYVGHDENGWGEVSDEEISEYINEEILAEEIMPYQDALALGLSPLQAEELELRKGQANDCLKKL